MFYQRCCHVGEFGGVDQSAGAAALLIDVYDRIEEALDQAVVGTYVISDEGL